MASPDLSQLPPGTANIRKMFQEKIFELQAMEAEKLVRTFCEIL
jgi:hypothetical protein